MGVPFIRKESTRNFMKLFSGTMIAQGMSFLLAPILARLFTPDDFGLLALYMSIFSILSVIATAKYEQAIMLPKNNRDAMSIVWLVLGISLVVSFVTLVLVLVFNQPFTRALGNPLISSWLLFLPASLMLHGIYQSATFYANRNKHFGLMATTTVVQYTVMNAFRLAAGWLRTAFNGLIAGQLLSQLSAALIMAIGEKKHLSTAATRPSVMEIRNQAKIYAVYPKYNMPLNFTNNLSGSLPIFLLTWGFSPAMAGLYAFGFNFVFRPISLFSLSAMQVLSQKIIDDHHHQRHIYPSLKRLLKRLLMIIGLPMLVMATGAPTIFEVVFSGDYRMAGTILQILSPYLLLVFMTSPLSFIPELFFRQKKAMIIDMIYLVLRAAALLTGIFVGSILLSMALFAVVSALVVSYNLFWYLSLARKYDKSIPIP